MSASSFGRFCLFLGMLCTVARAEGDKFSLTAQASELEQQLVVNELKCQAVQNALRAILKEKETYEKLDKLKLFSCDQLEKFIVHYLKKRSPENKTFIEVSGTIDLQSLKGWANALVTKVQPSSAQVMAILFSAQLPTLNTRARETLQRTRDNTAVQTLIPMISPAFQKTGFRAAAVDANNVVMERPARGEEEIDALRQSLRGANVQGAVWVNLTRCTQCSGHHAEIYFYQFDQKKMLISRAEDIAVDPRDLGNTAKIRAAYKSFFAGFQTELEELSSTGVLTGNLYEVTVEGFPSTVAYSTLHNQWRETEGVARMVVSQVSTQAVTFEIWSPLSSEELANSLSLAAGGPQRLKVPSIDQKSIRMRYLKG